MKLIRNICAVSLAVAGLLPGAAAIDSKDFTAADLFQLAKVWNVDFAFTQAAWKAMTPKNGPSSGHRELGIEGGRNGYAAANGVVLDYTHGNFTIDGKAFNDVAVRYKGNGTFFQGQGSGKISLKLDLNKYVKGQKLAKLDKLNFANNITDAGWMNEELSYRLFRDAGVPAPRTSYARVHVSVANQAAHQYLGLYSIVEDVDSAFTQDRFGMKDGLLLKPVTTSLFSYLGEDWKKYNQIYDPKSEMTPAQTRRVLDFCKLVTSAGDAEFAAKLGDFLDVDEFARFMAVSVWLTSLDSILDNGQNFYVWLNPRTQKFTFIAWDQDHSFGQFARYGSMAQRRTLSIARPYADGNPFLARVFSVPAFRSAYLAKMREFNGTIFRPERIIAQVNELAPAIRPAIVEESTAKAKWFDSVVGSDSGAFEETIKTFAKARWQAVADQLDGKAQGSVLHGGGGGGGTAHF